MKKLLIISALLFSFNGWTKCVDGNCSNGKGTYVWPNGDSYTGEWKDKLMHGKGDATWSDGSKYSGEYRYHKRHGKGDFAYVNGDHFTGVFINDMRNGRGTYTWADGGVRSGVWRDGVFVEKNSRKKKNTFGDMLIEAVAEGLVEGLVEKAIGCDEDEVKRVRHRTRSHPLGERQETIVYKEDC